MGKCISIPILFSILPVIVFILVPFEIIAFVSMGVLSAKRRRSIFKLAKRGFGSANLPFSVFTEDREYVNAMGRAEKTILFIRESIRSIPIVLLFLGFVSGVICLFV